MDLETAMKREARYGIGAARNLGFLAGRSVGALMLALVFGFVLQAASFQVRAQMDAAPDTFSLNRMQGGTTPSVYANDTLNGQPFDPRFVNITWLDSVQNLGQNTNTGELSFFPNGVASGVYPIRYRVCDAFNASVCDESVATLTVVGPAVVANADDFSAAPIDRSSGGTTASVVQNDTFNGQPAVIGQSGIRLTPGASPSPGLTMDGAGAISVALGTPVGSYIFPYTICDSEDTGNCATASATVVVRAGRDVADLALTASSDAGGSVYIGQPVTITFRPTNNGPDPRAAITVELTNTANLTIQSVSGGGCSAFPCTVAPNTPITVAAVVSGWGVASMSATAQVPSDVVDVVPGNNSAAFSTRASYDVRYVITGRILTPGPYLSGQTVQFELIARNEGRSDAPATRITQITSTIQNLEFPGPNSQSVCHVSGSCVIGNLAAGQSFREVFAARILAADQFSVSYDLSSDAGGGGIILPAIPGATIGSFANQATDMAVEHRLTTPGPYRVGQTVSFEAVVTDRGPYAVTAARAIHSPNNLRDIRVSGACSALPCTFGSMTTGAQRRLTIIATIAAPGNFGHGIVAASEMLDPDTSNDAASSEAVADALPIVANPDDFTGTPINGGSGGNTATVVGNDSLDGQPATVGSGGNVALTPGTSPNPGLSMNPDGTITVIAGTPAGTYVYPYTLCEIAFPSNCASGTATLTVDAATLVAAPDAIDTKPRTAVIVPVLGNDTFNGAPVVPGAVTITIVAAPAFGTATLNADGSVTYTPVQSVSGNDSFTYRICETINPGNCATATVTVAVTGTAPTANPDGEGVTGPVGQPLTFAVLGNDTDPDGDIDPTSLLLVGAGGDGKTLTVPGEGTWTVNPNGTLTFMPLQDFVGEVTPVQYTVADATGLRSSPAAVRASIVGRAQLNIVKTAQPRDVRIGDLVRYTLSVENIGDADAVDATVIDTPPPGFTYVAGSLSVADRDGAGRQTGSYPIRVDQIDIARGERATIAYLLRVGAGVRPGVHVNKAIAQDNGATVSNLAQAEVRLIADPLLDESLILGTVFDDRNANGYQDAGEPGIPGVRIASVEGLLIETDTFGRYHLEGIQGGAWERGRNFILKVDPATLPPGTTLTTANPLLRRITPGLPVRFDFGAKLPESAREEDGTATGAHDPPTASPVGAMRNQSNTRDERATQAPTASSQERTP